MKRKVSLSEMTLTSELDLTNCSNMASFIVLDKTSNWPSSESHLNHFLAKCRKDPAERSVWCLLLLFIYFSFTFFLLLFTFSFPVQIAISLSSHVELIPNHLIVAPCIQSVDQSTFGNIMLLLVPFWKRLSPTSDVYKVDLRCPDPPVRHILKTEHFAFL